ncbi:MAG: M28 family peptidase [Luteolibacter sp.]
MKQGLLLVGVAAIAIVTACLVGRWGQSGTEGGHLGQSAYQHTAAILAIGPRPAGSEGLAKVRAYVKGELEKSGWSLKEQTFKRNTLKGEVEFVNVRARFAKKGTDAWSGSREGILCAHIDSKAIPGIEFLGADDAASACAAIVEMARYLADKKPEQAEKLELVFFDGEEGFSDTITTLDGLFGSREYVSLWRGQAEKPRFGILLDMIGHKNLNILMPSDSPAFLKDHVLAAAAEENAKKHFTAAQTNYAITDDHVPLNQVGIPTIDIIGDFSDFNWWHNRDGGKDDLSVISAESLDISMRVTLRTLDRLFDKAH